MPRKPATLRPTSETTIVHDILLALGARSDCRIWRVNTGFARDPNTGRVVRFGQPGAADVQGLVMAKVETSPFPRGRFFALEVKSRHGRVSEQQRAWGAMVQRFGGFYAVVRSVPEALAALEEARR